MRNFFRILRMGRPYLRYAVLNAVFNPAGHGLPPASPCCSSYPSSALLLSKVEVVAERPAFAWIAGRSRTFSTGGSPRLIDARGDWERSR
jgi:hypothetical protein